MADFELARQFDVVVSLFSSVAQLLTEGKTDRKAARIILSLSVKTVETYRAAACATRLVLDDRTVRSAMRTKLAEP